MFGVADFYLGVDNKAKSDGTFKVYPNPANDKLYVQFNSTDISEKTTYSIVDLFGRTVLENKYNATEYIDISVLAEGVYFIQIVNGTQTATNKFIKTN